MLVKLGVFLNGIVGLDSSGADRALPAVASDSVSRKLATSLGSRLGGLDQFPTGQTRLATYRNPVVNAWDGDTANIACWVRNLDGQNFQVFAMNCAHLGCPVRWFPQSSLFMCPCHGGAYYQDGSRASGPPERGLFQYHYKIEDGKLLIKAGEMPTPGQRRAIRCAEEDDVRLIQKVGDWFDLRLQLGKSIRETAEHPVPRETASWFYVFGSAALTVLHAAGSSPASSWH